MGEIDYNSNFKKALLFAVVIAILSALTYGYQVHIIVSNFIVVWVFSFSCNSIVDLYYYFKKKQKEKKNGKR